MGSFRPLQARMYKMKVLEELSGFKTSTQYLNRATLSRP